MDRVSHSDVKGVLRLGFSKTGMWLACLANSFSRCDFGLGKEEKQMNELDIPISTKSSLVVMLLRAGMCSGRSLRVETQCRNRQFDATAKTGIN